MAIFLILRILCWHSRSREILLPGWSSSTCLLSGTWQGEAVETQSPSTGVEQQGTLPIRIKVLGERAVFLYLYWYTLILILILNLVYETQLETVLDGPSLNRYWVCHLGRWWLDFMSQGLRIGGGNLAILQGLCKFLFKSKVHTFIF